MLISGVFSRLQLYLVVRVLEMLGRTYPMAISALIDSFPAFAFRSFCDKAEANVIIVASYYTAAGKKAYKILVKLVQHHLSKPRTLPFYKEVQNSVLLAQIPLATKTNMSRINPEMPLDSTAIVFYAPRAVPRPSNPDGSQAASQASRMNPSNTGDRVWPDIVCKYVLLGDGLGKSFDGALSLLIVAAEQSNVRDQRLDIVRRGSRHGFV
ncbi:hypothetical protein MPER_11153 [Moniliophthora perniciosa FA553]|nr:hypothetical protein MPER_11153 [Moniliophthora perniciosa FA553]